MTRPLRFCMVTTFYPPYNFGGDGVFVQRLSNELARRGHRVDVIHCVDAYRSLARQEPTRSYDDHPNVTVHGLRSPIGILSPLATQQTGYPLFKSARIREILTAGFDVIHYHNISLVGGPAILAYGQGIKLYTMHEYWLVCQTHILFRFNRAACSQPACFLCSLVCKRPPQWWRYSHLLQHSVRRVDTFIAPSRFCQDMHRQMGLDVPIVQLPLFAPATGMLSLQSEDMTGGSAPEPYCLFVGRLEKLKGLQTLLPVFRRYPRAQLLVAGTGSDEPWLRQLAEGSANIRFLGYQSGQALQTLYRQAVAVILPSLCYEVFPQVAIEAFQQHTPVIVRQLGALPEIVEESGGGFVYQTDDDLVAALDHLLAHPAERQRRGQLGYEAYRRKWTPEVYLEHYFALIDDIAARRGKRFGKTAEMD